MCNGCEYHQMQMPSAPNFWFVSILLAPYVSLSVRQSIFSFIMRLSLVIFSIIGLTLGAPSGTQSESGTSLGSMAASGAAGVLVGLILAPSPDCDDVGVRLNET